MEYVFGDGDLTTKGITHTDLEGWQEVVRSFPQETITDRFRVTRKVKSWSDSEGLCYDWYEIDKHYRMIDRTGPIKAAETNQDELIVDQEYRLTMLELGV